MTLQSFFGMLILCFIIQSKIKFLIHEKKQSSCLKMIKSWDPQINIWNPNQSIFHNWAYHNKYFSRAILNLFEIMN